MRTLLRRPKEKSRSAPKPWLRVWIRFKNSALSLDSTHPFSQLFIIHISAHRGNSLLHCSFTSDAFRKSVHLGAPGFFSMKIKASSLVYFCTDININSPVSSPEEVTGIDVLSASEERKSAPDG
jgi:hypothetical protein